MAEGLRDEILQLWYKTSHLKTIESQAYRVALFA